MPQERVEYKRHPVSKDPLSQLREGGRRSPERNAFADRIKWIVDNRVHTFLLSPHLDDAGFSSFELAGYLSSHDVPVTVMTVFSHADVQGETAGGKDWKEKSGYTNAEALFEYRRTVEDVKACKEIGADFKHLGFVDMGWRGGQQAPIMQIQQRIREEIEKTVQGKPFVALAPIATGNNQDHIVLRDAIAETMDNVMYWQDWPYSVNDAQLPLGGLDQNARSFIAKHALHQIQWPGDALGQNARIRAIKDYDSQVMAVGFSSGKYPKGAKVSKEEYFVNHTSGPTVFK